MKLLLDGLFVLQGNLQLVLGILSLIFLGQFLISSVVKMIFGDGLTGEEYYSLVMAGWIVPVSLLSLLWYLLRTAHLPDFSTLIVIIFISINAIPLFVRINKQITRSSKGMLAGLLLLFCIFVLLRLAF